MHDRKIIEIMSRVITKCQNDEDYTIIYNFQTNYTSRLFVVYNRLGSTNWYLINEEGYWSLKQKKLSNWKFMIWLKHIIIDFSFTFNRERKRYETSSKIIHHRNVLAYITRTLINMLSMHVAYEKMLTHYLAFLTVSCSW